MAGIRWRLLPDGVEDARQGEIYGPGVGVITQEYIDAARERLGLPERANVNAVLARLKLRYRAVGSGQGRQSP